MSNAYAYKPRLGFDIRVKPPQTDEPPVWEPQARVCDAEGCSRRADCRAPKSPDNIKDFHWFCTEHARSYNRSWNFFTGMSESEARDFRESAVYGHRPTWKITLDGKTSQKAKAGASNPRFYEDAFDLFKDAGVETEAPPAEPERKLSRLQVKAFGALGLATNAPADKIRLRYKELVKRFHPDANGGDRSTEAKLQDVIKAYELLRRANVC